MLTIGAVGFVFGMLIGISYRVWMIAFIQIAIILLMSFYNVVGGHLSASSVLGLLVWSVSLQLGYVLTGAYRSRTRTHATRTVHNSY